MKKTLQRCNAISLAFLLQAFLLVSSAWGVTPTEEWTARYTGGKVSTDDYAVDMAVDDSGNVYVTGYSYNSATGYDYATVKYDTVGNELWVQRYDQGNDYAVAIGIDASGNVYVSGYSDDADGVAYATVKYDGATGAQLWERRYGGPLVPDYYTYFTYVEAMVVDGSGNVYVTGYSWGADYYYDYATVKYDSAGNELWVERYDGPDGRSAYARSIAVDSSGDVYVTGDSYGYDLGPYAAAYATVKYDGATGTPLWVQRHAGQGGAHANAIAVDSSGDVYVTGSGPGEGYDPDYVTIKYDSTTGNQVWLASYDGQGLFDDTDIARAIAVDSSGNVYVTGFSHDYGIATIKYDGATGNAFWAERYPGSPTAITIDDGGNVYVTGSDRYRGYITVKYDSAGNELWVQLYHGPTDPADFDAYAEAIAVDHSGNVYVTGVTDYDFRHEGGLYIYASPTDYATIKYDSAGNESWLRRYDGPGINRSEPVAMAVDGSGNVYVTGTAGDIYGPVAGTDVDCLTVKYDAAGNELWVRRYNGPGDSYDFPVAIAVDGSGNVYVTGGTYSGGSNYAFATIKYDGAGNEVWTAIYQRSSREDQAQALALDGSGVYVTGFAYVDTANAWDYVTIKYDSTTGNQVWVASYNGPGSDTDYPVAMALDGSGNIYVTGESYSSDAYADLATVKYDSAGNELWARNYSGPDYDYVYALAVDDSSDSVVVSGYDYDSGPVMIKYAGATGDQLWERFINVFPSPMAMDGSGNIFIGDTVKYDSAGNELWAHSAPYGAAANAIDGNGDLYVTGGAYCAYPCHPDYATRKYDGTTGNEIWFARYDGPSNLADVPVAIAVDSGGNAYVTGSSADLFTGINYLTVKYSAYVNQIPTADAGGPYLVAVGGSIALDGSASSDPDGDALSESWSATEGTVSGSTYTAGEAPGIYEIQLVVNDGYVDSSPDVSTVVVYDPDGGFVTGGGQIASPEGAYPADPDLTGMANFGFVSRYKKGANEPTGQTEFQFRAGDLNFHSDSYQWLVVNQGGSNAQFKGEGTVNRDFAPTGQAYKFMLWCGDGDNATPAGTDTFRIKIWYEDAAGEVVVYDNGFDQPIAGGSIVIHNASN